MKSFLLIFGVVALALPLYAAPMTAGQNEAFVLLNNASIFREKSMGNLEFAETATLGDKVVVQGGIVKAKFDGKERDYYKVKLPSGKEGFIRANVLGIGGTLGVVKADGVLTYSEPRDVKVTDRSLSRAQVAVVLKDGSTDQFIHVVGYEDAKDLPFDLYVASSDVSINDVDLSAVILLTVAKSQKNPAVKKNLLTAAVNKYSTSQFMDLVQAQLGPRATKPLAGTFAVNDDNVNVRDLPNEAGSKVVGTLGNGQIVTVVEVTADSYTVGGKTAPWYRVQAPAGWVFGTFLTQQ